MNYLNISEIRSVCDEFGIPYKILYRKGGRLLKASTFDRKDVLLERIRSFVGNGEIPEPTVLEERIVDLGPIPNKPKETDLIKFGQFKHGHKGIESLLEKLSEGKFKDGAIARDVLRDFWTEGEAPTYTQFLKAWFKAVKEHTKPKAEWAYLTDLGNGMDMEEWKKYRTEKARRVIAALRELAKKKPKAV